MAVGPPPPRPRVLVPHEHGAWGQLLLPLVCGLALGRLTAAAAMLAIAVVLAFIAHEPLLVLLGQRGARALAEDGARARWWVGAVGGAAAVSGAAGLVLATPAARVAALVPAALAAGGLTTAVPLAVAPPLLVSAVVCLAQVSPRRIRTLGWTLAGSSVVTMVVLVVRLR